ncbi:BnaC09g39610D [Brassica napus]|uniref:(rape) hypothetical protein n=1 Tax=Brassica napus TaxID=3708 RepID=A0A078GJ90_BRANA|nr:unnamed protein product [Brassica napus]CDY25446.1 BnaC09g39610D [Brassica napus]
MVSTEKCSNYFISDSRSSSQSSSSENTISQVCGHTSQVYAIRQSIAKALVAFYQNYVDEQSKKEVKDVLIRYDRTLFVADPRRCEPKKFGGRGARSCF